MIDHSELFREIPNIQFTKIKKFFQEACFNNGEKIIVQNEYATKLFIIKNGICDITVNFEGKDIHLESIKKGEVFGEMSFITGSSISATVTAKGNVKVYFILRDNINSLIMEDKELAFDFLLALLKVISKRLKVTSLNFALYDYLLSTIKKKNEQLEIVNEELKKTSDTKNEFIAIAAHDIRNPVTIINGYISSFISGSIGKLSEKQKGAISVMKNSCSFLLNTLNDLLDISMIEAGKLKLNLKKQKIKDVVLNAFNQIKILAEKKKIKFVLEGEDYLKENVIIDYFRIYDVLINLYSNAIKFSRLESKIVTRLEREGKYLKVSIQDFGVGMKKNDLEKLFKPFSKTDAEPTGGEKSTGLGLSIVKKTMEAHKTKISVQSELNKGSTFSFILPIHK